MMRGRRALTIAALCVLASAATAHAECAWVLWGEETTTFFSYRTADAGASAGKMDQGNTHVWNLLASHPTKNACEKQLDSRLSSTLKAWKKEGGKSKSKSGEQSVTHESSSNTISRKTESSGETTIAYSTTIRYLCMPDSMDPRAPKKDGAPVR
jgi:hypothetical protein